MDGNMAVTDPDSHLMSVTPSYRRNGKLFSCEPCRRGKLRCDHSSPVCGRCARRNKPDQCIYHPAPLTKARTSPTIGPRRTNSSSASSSRRTHAKPYPTVSRLEHSTALDNRHFNTEDHSRYGVTPANNFSSLGEPTKVSSLLVQPRTSTSNSLSESRASSTYASNESSMTHRDARTGFLGSTSWSAVYTENSSILEPPEVDDNPHLPALSAEKIQQGAEVLSMLRDLPIYRKFCERWFDTSDGILIKRPIFQVWVDELWDQFGPLLTEGQPDRLRALSGQVWRNSRRPMEVHGNMSARQWARSASGQNLRWEVVGALMTLVGLIAANLSNWDSIFDAIRERYVDRATFSERMRKASEYCLCFCYESEVLNDIYLCFIYEDLILVESMKGDAHYASWQRLGEVCDAVVAMGLHQGNYPDAKTPFWLAEMRKKFFISVYGHDKVVATFLGRPPRLSHRYCKMEPPLDLSDEELLSEGEELRLAIANLDQDGWNTSGQFHRITWVRVWFQHCRLREDILEIALGSGEEDIVLQADRVRAKMDSINDPIPAFMKVTPEQFFLTSGSPRGNDLTKTSREIGPRQVNVIFMLCIQTGLVHTEFLLQRALVSRLKTNTKQLIPIARRMLQLVLLAQSKRDFFRDFQGDLVYLLALHGLPAAGVLAVELLKQEQTRQYTPSLLPRSDTVQDLSVFISALAAVGPGEGNFSICDQGRRALKKVLDQILSPTMTAPPMPMPDGLTAGVDEGGWGFPIGNDADFLSWLDNVEWDKRDWGEPAVVNGVVNGL